MKFIHILFLAIVLSATYQAAFGESETYRQESPRRLYLTTDKEQQLIQVAKDVCAKMADYDISTLTPLLFSFPRSPIPLQGIGDRKVVSVKFMKDTTDYNEYYVYSREAKEKILIRKPNAIISVGIFPDTMQPANIEAAYDGTTYFTIFAPNYTDFCKQNPDYKVQIKEYETPEYIKNLRNVNEVAKEELEAQGYKVTIGTTDDK